MGEPLRIVQVGAGGMGRAWLRTLRRQPSVVLAGLVDLDPETARVAAGECGYDAVPVAASLDELADQVGAQAVIDVTVPVAHPTVSIGALRRGLPVLCEKPVAETVRESLIMAAAAEASGRLLMVSQSRRYFRAVNALTRLLAELGPVGTLAVEHFKALQLDGFRARMAEPLLVDMAIHQFDLARKLLADEPVSVYCESYNPEWSSFDGNAAATALFTFAGGARFSFTGSWCAPGLETPWNGTWRAVTARGTAVWDGSNAPIAELSTGEPLPATLGDEPEEIDGSLQEFVAAINGGPGGPEVVPHRREPSSWDHVQPAPQGEIHTNILSLAMVEAAVRSARTGVPVQVADVVTDAYQEALTTAPSDVVPALKSWSSPLTKVGLSV